MCLGGSPQLTRPNRTLPLIIISIHLYIHSCCCDVMKMFGMVRVTPIPLPSRDYRRLLTTGWMRPMIQHLPLCVIQKTPCHHAGKQGCTSHVEQHLPSTGVCRSSADVWQCPVSETKSIGECHRPSFSLQHQCVLTQTGNSTLCAHPTQTD